MTQHPLPRAAPVSDAVREEAIDDLLAAATACVEGTLEPPLDRWVDRAVAAAEARRFKLDVSFALRFDGRSVARASLNDKGEPLPFRRRVAAHFGSFEAFFAAAAPGEVQTTLGLKWGRDGGHPARMSLYFEELSRSPRAAAIHEAVARLAIGRSVPPVAGLQPAAVCIDVADGIVGFKDYGCALETSDRPLVALPATLERFRAFFPRDPVRGTRRYLYARRFDAKGTLTGAKLLWMSEAHDAEAADRAWAIVDALRARLALPPSRPGHALDRLRAGWEHAPFLYPDLVSLDVDATGKAAALVVYVSMK